jgi:hypothetical protein
MIDSSLKNIDAHMDQLLQQGLPSGARQWLGMLGFRIVVDHHGEMLKLDQPGIAALDDELCSPFGNIHFQFNNGIPLAPQG